LPQRSVNTASWVIWYDFSVRTLVPYKSRA
jgi:hypothetical protein